MNDPQITTVAIEKQNKAYAFLLFLISPLLVVILAAKDFRKSWAKNIIWLFVIFYGATFVISNDKIDANRYRDQLYEFSTQELTPVSIFEMLYGPESQVLDILQPLLTLTVSLFTTNFHVLFAVFGLVFGFFYSRNIWYLLDRTEGKLEWSAVILMMTFAFVVGFWEINGFRFWTAAHIFFYGVFPYVADRNRKKLWFAVLAIFVHFSFLLPLMVLIAYMLVGNRARILFYLFIATSLVSEVNLEVVRNSLNSVLPSFFKEKVDTYTNEVYVEHRAIKNANPSLHFVLYKKALVYGVFIFLVFIYYMGLDYARKYKYLFNLFCFSLLFLSVTNISSLVPSGGRFTTIAILFAMSVIFFYVRSVPLKPPFRILLPVVLMGFVLYIVVAFRAGTDTIGVMTLFGNPIQLLFVESDTAVIELIK